MFFSLNSCIIQLSAYKAYEQCAYYELITLIYVYFLTSKHETECSLLQSFSSSAVLKAALMNILILTMDQMTTCTYVKGGHL